MLPPIQPIYQPAQVIVPLTKPVGQVSKINPDRDPSSQHDHNHNKNQSGGNPATQTVEDDSHTPPTPKPHHNRQIDVWAGSTSHNAASTRLFL